METADLSHHISRRFNEDLERVRSKVLGMGGFVEQQLHKAITALVEGDSSLGEAVALDDHQVNNMEIAIHEACSRILATPAPAVGDLRVGVATTKNTSEYTIYRVRGTEIRHTSLDDVERELREGRAAGAAAAPSA